METRWPQGLKKTRQREDVYRVLKEANEPLTAMEIYRQVMEHTTDSNYAISTIYRCLSAFDEYHLLEKSTLMGEDMAVYELKGEHHTHYAICLTCRKKIQLHQCPMESIHLDARVEDFQVTGHKLELYGYCKACREGETSH